MKIVAIVQARMGSARLPGKVLKDVGGQSVLARVVQRLRRAHLVHELFVATTDGAADNAIVAECERCSVDVYRGDETDVLDRYFHAARRAKADVVVRITADCPLIDPDITDKTIEAFLKVAPDYASNALTRTYPRGLDTEVISFPTLSRAWREARKPYEREHVTPYVYEHPNEFRILRVTGERDFANHRWTLDTPEDLEFVQALYARLRDKPGFGWKDALEILDREPQLVEINRSVIQKPLHGVT